jgi:hypothetical protein
MIFQGVGIDIAGRRVHILEVVLYRSKHYRASQFGCVLPIAEGSNKIFTVLIGGFLISKIHHITHPNIKNDQTQYQGVLK